MKLTGCILLLCACGALSLGAVQVLKTRVDQLLAFVAALEEMERELQCQLAPMPELLSDVYGYIGGPVGEFFRLCAGRMDRLGERSFAQLWREALEAADLCLEEEDRRLLEELGGSLGRYDSRSQCRALEQTRKRLEENLAEASRRRERLGRVYGALGLAAAAFLMILLV